MPDRFFITGTDTGVGKTVASSLLCAALDAMYWKPIQTGTREDSDTKTVLRLAGIPRTRIVPEAYRFAPPVSPHLAARLAGVRISLRTIRLPRMDARRSLIVEGAGGAMVPINERQLMVDLMKRLRLPVLLVARTSLGTINHTLLSLAALRAARVDVRGVILAGARNQENRAAIEKYGRAPVVGWIPLLPKIDRAALLRVFEKEFDASVFETWHPH
jgi:dethiobiotin synthase